MEKMVLDGAIAAEAWSQLVRSILSNNPPRDMSRDYYYTSPETGSDYLQKQFKRLERYKYKLGTANIRTRMRYGLLSEPADEPEYQQGIEHIRGFTRSGKHLQVLQQPNEGDEDKQGIEHVGYYLISTKHSQVVPADEDGSLQGIEHVRESIRSTKHSQLSQANGDVKGHVPDSPRSVLRSGVVVEPYEDEYPQGIEHIQYCPISTKHSQVVQRNEDEYEQGIGRIRDPLRSSKHYQLGRADEDEDENLQGIEYEEINKEEYQQEIKHIQNSLIFDTHSAQDQSCEDGIYIEHTRDSIKSTVSFKPTEYDDRQLINYRNQARRSTEFPEEPEDAYQQWNSYKEARKMSTLFDELLELIQKADVIRQEKPILRFQVLKVIKLLHHYGIDIIRRGVENELEDENLKCDEMEEDMEIYFKKKGLEAMLRVCDTETCQRTIYDIIGKAERHQVFFI